MTNEPTLSTHKRRRRLIVDKPMQYRMVRLLLGVWGVNTLFFAAVLYFFYRLHLAQFYDLMPRRDVVSSISTSTLVALLVAYLVAFGLVKVVLIGLYFSNHIAGPLYRVRMALGRIREGDLNVEVAFRDGDFLSNFPEAFNQTVRSVREREVNDLERLRMIEASLKEPEKARALVRSFVEAKEARVGLPASAPQEEVPEPVH